MSDDELPRALAIAWGMETSPTRGPKRELSHESIVDAAIEIANSEGLAAVTMQRVAKSFGFTTMALYRYVSSKDDLQVLMLDRANALATDALIDDTDWRVGLRDWSEAARETVLRHPWVLELSAPRAAAGNPVALPNMMRMIDNAMRAMRTLQIPLLAKFGVVMKLSNLATESAALELEKCEPSRTPLGPTAIRAIQEVATRDRFPDLYPLITDGTYFTIGTDLGDPAYFGEQLTETLDGLAALADASAEPAEPVDPSEPGPQEALALAERDWRTAVALRKQAAQRLKDLTRVEAERQAALALAKEQAKIAARAGRRQGD